MTTPADTATPHRASLRISTTSADANKALTRRRTTGETTVRAQRGHKLPKLAPFYVAMREYVAERAVSRSRNCERGCW